MSAEPLLRGDTERVAPTPPGPAGVVDLGRYRGRTTKAPTVAPPARDDEIVGSRSTMAPALSAPVLVPDWDALAATEVEDRPDTDVARGVSVGAGEVVIRRVRLRSVFKMTFGFLLCAVIVVVGAGVLVWTAISTLGVVENLESLAEDLGWVDVHFDGPAMFRAACIGGGILVVAGTFLSVVFAEIFNLLSTITGGLRAEVGPPPPTRRERRRARKSAKRRAKAARKS